MNVKQSILFEDNHLLVINKPAGLSSLPNEGMEDVLTICKAYIKKRDEKKGNVFLHPVHRLDRKVSGALVMAKSQKALSRLNEQIREKLWDKEYICELENILPESSGVLEHFLCKRKFFADVYSTEKAGAKKAILSYVHLKDRFYLVSLQTGRYHQIRAQMSFMKCPIVGDKKYGSKTKRSQIHLHHHKVIFPHPVTKESLEICCDPPFFS